MITTASTPPGGASCRTRGAGATGGALAAVGVGNHQNLLAKLPRPVDAAAELLDRGADLVPWNAWIGDQRIGAAVAAEVGAAKADAADAQKDLAGAGRRLWALDDVDDAGRCDFDGFHNNRKSSAVGLFFALFVASAVTERRDDYRDQTIS